MWHIRGSTQKGSELVRLLKQMQFNVTVHILLMPKLWGNLLIETILKIFWLLKKSKTKFCSLHTILHKNTCLDVWIHM